MPRLTDASRQARRDAITEATLRVFEHQGVAHASMADIIEELGGSAGGVYSHFTSKAELVRSIAGSMLTRGLEAISAHDGTMRPPAQILRAALVEIVGSAPTAVVVQLWGEATVDPEMRPVVLDTLSRIEASLRRAVLPWARTMPGDPEARADRTSRAMRAISQGYIVQLALFGQPAAERYLDDLAEVLASTG